MNIHDMRKYIADAKNKYLKAIPPEQTDFKYEFQRMMHNLTTCVEYLIRTNYGNEKETEIKTFSEWTLELKDPNDPNSWVVTSFPKNTGLTMIKVVDKTSFDDSYHFRLHARYLKKKLNEALEKIEKLEKGIENDS